MKKKIWILLLLQSFVAGSLLCENRGNLEKEYMTNLITIKKIVGFDSKQMLAAFPPPSTLPYPLLISEAEKAKKLLKSFQESPKNIRNFKRSQKILAIKNKIMSYIFNLFPLLFIVLFLIGPLIFSVWFFRKMHWK